MFLRIRNGKSSTNYIVPVINKYHHGNRVPPGAVDIMRGSRFGNPFVIGVHGDRGEVIAKFKRHLWRRMRNDPQLRTDLLALHGATVCCCCAPAPCHGDVLLEAAAWVASQAGVTPD